MSGDLPGRNMTSPPRSCAGVVPSGVGVGVSTTEGQYGVNVIPGGGGLKCSSTNRIN